MVRCNSANCLTNVNGQAYTWDNNGNLTNDGSKTYLYNQANQLTGITATPHCPKMIGKYTALPPQRPDRALACLTHRR